MCLFWKHGYEGTSIDLLSRETKMPRASLYQRFGGKEGLFLATLDHYGETRIAPLIAALGPSGKLNEDLVRFYDAVVDLATQAGAARGCLISCVLSDAAGANPRFRDELEKRFAVLEDHLTARIQAAGPDETRSTSEPRVQAMLLAAIARGIMVRARAGSTSEDLAQVGRAAAALVETPLTGSPGSVHTMEMP